MRTGAYSLVNSQPPHLAMQYALSEQSKSPLASASGGLRSSTTFGGGFSSTSFLTSFPTRHVGIFGLSSDAPRRRRVSERRYSQGCKRQLVHQREFPSISERCTSPRVRADVALHAPRMSDVRPDRLVTGPVGSPLSATRADQRAEARIITENNHGPLRDHPSGW